ncbi:hypothetical protein [Pedobacter frigoris]|uniref:hypothetical protein n=1 Tax=Pedobacter frigoris TaxID=2571272 RepID=UPI00292F1CB5|nr:hypothetical protein [Pedobacter frigoris]
MLEIEIKSSLFDRDRKLIINSELITYDDSDWKDIPNTTFNRGEVAAYRFGVEPLQGYAFTIGRRYNIDIKGVDNRVIKIRFKSLYGIRDKILRKNFTTILKALSSHHEDIYDRYIETFRKTSSVEILGTQFGSNSVKLGSEEVSHDDVEFAEYNSYFALYSKSNPKIYKSYSYLKDWNAVVVYYIAKQILYGSKTI